MTDVLRTRRKSTIELRAAQHFGMERDPRRSIKVGRYKVLVFCRRGSALVMGVYSEEGNEPKGEYLYMDGDQPQQILDAITGSFDA